MALTFPYAVKRINPAVWIERIALYSSFQEQLREISFTRGLNIIWGVELDDTPSDMNPILISGHSVGKTTLCRLIRYCLGESKYGTAAAEERIREHFPQGFVIADIHVDGTVWHVRRDFSVNRQSYGTCDSDFENLLSEKPSKELKYDKFKEAIKAATISLLVNTATPDKEFEFTWDNILAWLTRDQEARYQSLWDWRSTRSESSTPKFKKPKEYPLYLIRLLLGLVHETEIVLQNKIFELQKEIDSCKCKSEELRIAPEKEFHRTREKLQESLLPDSFIGVDTEGLFSLESKAEGKMNRLGSEVNSTQQQLNKLNQKVDHYGAEINRGEDKIKFILAVLSTSKKSSNTGAEKNRLAELENEQSNECRYGRITFKDCEHFDAYINELKAIAERKAIPLFGRSDTELEQSIGREDETLRNLRSSVEQNKTHRQKYSIQRDELQQSLATAQYRITLIEACLKNFSSSTKRLNEPDGNTELAELLRKIELLEKELKATEAEIVSAQSVYKKNLEILTLTYNWVTKNVLSETYSGLVTMPDGDPRFDISEKTGLSGEAVETLAIILADFTALLCSTQDLGFHPRFLVHDSPREADLDRQVYNHFLRVVGEISENVGGANAPFQYIITTTSKPPEVFFKNNTIKAELRADPEDRMLFRCRLGRLVEQTELFVDDKVTRE